uniref:NADH dehydrogenase [ubiquinone] 1 beta subcomplex subunit 5, mitochondrial n=1 Tax=Romanomermis culicivorax TaxID=13658 RepID=A0A915IY62_ROMCU
MFNLAVFVGLPLFLLNLFYGRCELREIPADYEPRFWEYENQPIKQLKMKYGYGSMQRKHEKCMAFGHQSAKNYFWRIKEERIHHLMFERQDYKAWYYIPYQAKWNNLSHQLAEKTIFNRDPIHMVRQSNE